MNIKLEKKYEKILNDTNLPGSVAFLMSYLVSEYGSNLERVLIENAGKEFFSYNDMYIIYHEHHDGLVEKNIVEIANPYARYEYAFINFNEFNNVVKKLIDGSKIKDIKILNVSEFNRHDVSWAQENWEEKNA